MTADNDAAADPRPVLLHQAPAVAVRHTRTVLVTDDRREAEESARAHAPAVVVGDGFGAWIILELGAGDRCC